MAANERTARGSAKDIVSALKKKDITYDQAKNYMMDFTKDGLVRFILNPYTETETTTKSSTNKKK